MSRISKKITNWLYSVLQPQYENPETTYQDIVRFLSVYLDRGFKIRTAVYTSVSGGSDLLVNIYGPLCCGNNVYQVEIWVPLNYPYPDLSGETSNVKANGVPIGYIISPKGYCIRPGNNIDSQGQIYHPFLVDWFKTMKPGYSTDQFNLISLMTYITSTFERNCPIGLLPETTGPALPPKPFSGLESSQQIGMRSSNSGPPLPQKGSLLREPIKPIPEKYMGPPPLPPAATQVIPEYLNSVESQFSHTGGLPLNPTFTRPREVGHNWPTGHHRETSSGHPEVMQSVQETGQVSGSPKPGRKPPGSIVPAVEDLMDQMTIESKKDHSNPLELQRIAHFINMHLDSNNPQSVNSLIPKINELKNKASALYSQLMHHNTQAKANANNLDNHVEYLTNQVSSIEQSNHQLHQLSEKNMNCDEQVFLNTSGERAIAIEDLILPDSALVRQLYDTVAEINGYKDAIKLVGGNYKSEQELINDETLDSCVRSVRALSRELFWLEVTKNEIARVMGLQM